MAPQLWLLGMLSVAYAPMFWGQIIFFRDPAHWNYPARAFVRKALLNGEFPHWNPFTGLGLPVWGNPLYGVFYPPNWLLLLVPESLLANALTWQSFGHTFFGGWGAIVLARQFGCGRMACLVAGLAWSMGGYTTSMWSAGLLLIPGAWVPWVAVGAIAAIKSVLAGNPWSAVGKLGIPLAFAMLTGEPFVAFMALGFGLLTALAWRVHGVEGLSIAPSARKTVLLTLAAACSIGLMVSAIVVLPARAVLSNSPRANGVSKAEAERYSLHPLRLIEFVAPESFGLPVLDYPGGKYVGEKSIDGMPLAFSVYFGAAAVALALMAFGARRTSAFLLMAFWLLVLLLAFGRHTPLHGLWRTVALPFAYMRYPEKYAVLLVGWAALLAGLGTQRLLEGFSPWKRTFGLLAVVAGLAVGCSFVLEPHIAHYVREGAARGATALVLLLGLFWLGRKRPAYLGPALCALVFVDLAPVVWSLQPFGPGRMVLGMPPMAEAIAANTKQAKTPRLYRSNATSDEIARLAPADSMASSESRWLRTLVPNFGSSFGIGTLPGYDAATSKHFDALWEEGTQFGVTLLRLLAVDFALLAVRDPTAPDKRGDEHYQALMDPLPGARLYKTKTALPRAYVVGAAAVLSEKRALHLLFTPEVVEGKIALIAEGQGGKPIRTTPRRVGNCEILSSPWSQLKAVCEATEAGLAVFVEQFDPAWHATVDGRPQQVLRVNVALRGIELPPGRHTISMHYKPRGLVSATIISLLGLFLLAAAEIQAYRKREAMVH